jgi:mono/diheme cytochrome c family protein
VGSGPAPLGPAQRSPSWGLARRYSPIVRPSDIASTRWKISRRIHTFLGRAVYGPSHVIGGLRQQRRESRRPFLAKEDARMRRSLPQRLHRFSLGSAIVLLAAGCGKTRSSGSPPAEPSEASSADARADALLLAAAKIALPPPGIEPGDLADPTSSGAKLVAKYCAQCHSLPSPGMHSATDWPRVLRRMWLRMDRLPDSLHIIAGDEGERGTVLAYLTANALRVSGAELPPGTGRQEFAVVCSRCHALPDIKNHSARDWPSIFMRMERNMERMNVRPPTQEEGGKILLYLQGLAKPK